MNSLTTTQLFFAIWTGLGALVMWFILESDIHVESNWKQATLVCFVLGPIGWVFWAIGMVLYGIIQLYCKLGDK
jgi:hypothetical protein